MVLMSSLLCAFTALLSLVLGDVVKFNHSVAEEKLIDASWITSDFKFNNISDSANTYLNDCNKCQHCMKENVDPDISRSKAASTILESLKDVMWSDNGRRKRDVNNTLKIKKTKTKKTKNTIRITKYKIGEDVYAMKIKEKSGNQKYNKEMCKLYSVMSSLPCDSLESEKIISKISKDNTKRGASKKTDQSKSEPIYKQHEADSSQVVESYMPSIEDLY